MSSRPAARRWPNTVELAATVDVKTDSGAIGSLSVSGSDLGDIGSLSVSGSDLGATGSLSASDTAQTRWVLTNRIIGSGALARPDKTPVAPAALFVPMLNGERTAG